MKRAFLFLLALSLVLTIGAFNAPQSTAEAQPAETPSLASFKAVDLDGNEVDQTIFAEYNLTMINIWATFCGPCLSEMPELGELAAEYADKGVRVVGIVADIPRNADGTFDADMVKLAQEIVKETGAEYLHLLPGDDLIAAKLNTVLAVPETIFVDSEGNVVGNSYIGSRSGEEWAKIVDALLAEVKG
ncbi:MAG: TlpA family protein disulfide reductase [Christensenellales bacterium]|jgi:thiol-disulfide isomerase/thioredoxin